MLESIFAKESFKSGHVHGLQNRRTNAPLRPTTPKRASANERAINQGAGATPATLCVRAFSEKAWIPARDRAGNHRRC